MLERSRSTCLDSEKICFAYDSILNDIIYLFIQHIEENVVCFYNLQARL